MDLSIKKLNVAPIGTNCYIVINNELKEAVIIDPGGDEKIIEKTIDDMNLTPKGIFLTHGHYDHMGGANYLKARYHIDIFAGKDEEDVLKDDRKNLSTMFGDYTVVDVDVPLNDGNTFELIGLKFKVIHTPGHTKGGICFYLEDEKILFSGDTMFNGSYGRYDFPTGNLNALMDSIKNKLLVLDGETKVYPGHESSTTIKDERIYYDFN